MPPAGDGDDGDAGAAAGTSAPADAAHAPPAPTIQFKRPAGRARGNLRRKLGGSGGDDDDNDDDGGGADVAKRAKTTTAAAPTTSAAAPLVASTRAPRSAADALPARYGGDRSLQSGRDELATAHLQTETEHDRDNRAIREAVLAAGTSGAAPAGEYRGEKARTDYRAGFRRADHTAGAEKGGGAHGPLRAPTAARTTVLVDYAPDICKDYKETGYCGYGDACKFMHDRGDYKAGWQIDAEWEAKKKAEAEAAARADAWAEAGEGAKNGGEKKGEEGKEGGGDGGLPFACLACRVAWTARSRPVVTPCRHYFCEACALAQAASTCPACGRPTGGTFNAAASIEARIKKAAAEAEGGAAEEEDAGGWGPA